MRIKSYDDVRGFWAEAESFLLANEAEYNLMIGIARQAIVTPERYPNGVFTATVEREGRVEGVALMTPPFPLSLTHWPDEALSILVDEMSRRLLPANGVIAPTDTARRFSAAYCRVHPQMSIREEKAMQIYSLDAVTFPDRIPAGRVTLGDSGDIDVALEYLEGFFEMHGHRNLFNLPDVVRCAIDEKRLFLWRNKQPVSMAVWVRDTPNAKAVGYVYTPEAERGKGYATALMAEVSRRALDEGKRYSVLYADLENPVSNSIYQKIGYRPVGEATQIIINAK